MGLYTGYIRVSCIGVISGVFAFYRVIWGYTGVIWGHFGGLGSL